MAQEGGLLAMFWCRCLAGIFYKAKKNKCYVSKLVTYWKTWLNAFFFNVFFFFSEQQTCQIWVGHSFEIWNLIFDEQDTRQNTRVEEVCCSKCFIVSVIYFLVFFDMQVIKKWKKKSSKQKKFKPWILLNQTRTEKQMRAAALRDRIYFF